MEQLGKHIFPIAVGTPSRLSKLAEYGALQLTRTTLLLVDTVPDAKGFNVLTLPDAKQDLDEFMSVYVSPQLSHIKLALIG